MADMHKPASGSLVALLIICAHALPVSAVQYVVTDLGSLGGVTTAPLALNTHGEAVGWSYATGVTGQRAFLSAGGVIQDLGSLGGAHSQALGINAAGQVVGWSNLPGTEHGRAFLYSNGVMQNLGTLGGAYSWAYGINSSGQVVGSAYNTRIGRAFIYANGSMQDLGSLADSGSPSGSSAAYAVNDGGQVTGYTRTQAGVGRAFLYSNGVMQEIGSLGGTSYGSAINAGAQIAGYSYLAEGGSTYHAFLYSEGVMNDLGTLGGTHSRALGINDQGQVVGWTYDARQFVRPFLYENGSMVDLNTLLVPGSGWRLHDATAINNRGQIVGSGWNAAGKQHGYLLTPIPEPAGLPLLALGGSILLKRAPRRGTPRRFSST